MKILDKNNAITQVVDLILSKAKYQKVALCLDENSDMEFVDNIINQINKDVILLKYYYNKSNISSFYNMVNNGVRVVIYNVDIEHFYQLQNDNNYILNVFLPQSNFLLPYLTHNESIYGDNLLICNTKTKDYTTLLFMYESAFNKVWDLLLQGVEVDTDIFKNIDAIANDKVDFYPNILNQLAGLKKCIGGEYQDIKESQLPYYIYLRLCAILKMLENLLQCKEQYIDFYKTELSVSAIEKAHSLLLKYDIIKVLKYNCENLIKINSAILNRTKIIIKKYFNFNQIKLNKLNKIIKAQSKLLNMEKLLYISYIFNVV